jgi:L-aspartate oxidase
LSRLGIAFDTTSDGQYELAREGGHSHGRILHAKDTTGRTISGALLKQLHERANKNPDRMILLENCFAETLVTKNGCLTGAILREVDGGRATCITAQHVVLATGGAGQIYSRTTNPAIATADGVALAYRAGAVLADLEFMQFHPTALSLSGAPAFLISEAVRGEGALLLDGNGRRFAGKFHPDAELATRDVVARAIHATMLEQELECVWLDLRPMGQQNLLQKFPNIISNCRQFGVDPLTMPVPVAPAAHYFMGGVMADTSGRTSVPGLYCIGEVASTGLHGANRLASNSLLEAGVMAMKLANLLTHQSRTSALVSPIMNQPDLADAASQVVPQSLLEFRQSMFKHAGLTRTETSLNALFQSFAGNSLVPSAPGSESEANMLLVAELIARAAWLRKESRGAHCRQDYPQSDDHQFRRRLTVCLDNWLWSDLVSDQLAMQKQALSA